MTMHHKNERFPHKIKNSRVSSNIPIDHDLINLFYLNYIQQKIATDITPVSRFDRSYILKRPKTSFS